MRIGSGRRWMAVAVGVLLLGGGAALHAGAPPQRVTLVAKEFAYTPATLTVTAGRPVQLELHNQGVVEHDFVIDQFKVKMGLVGPGKKATLTFTPKTKGSFAFYCSVPGHKEAGMRGTLVVK